MPGRGTSFPPQFGNGCLSCAACWRQWLAAAFRLFGHRPPCGCCEIPDAASGAAGFWQNPWRLPDRPKPVHAARKYRADALPARLPRQPPCRVNRFFPSGHTDPPSVSCAGAACGVCCVPLCVRQQGCHRFWAAPPYQTRGSRSESSHKARHPRLRLQLPSLRRQCRCQARFHMQCSYIHIPSFCSYDTA